MVCIIGQYSGKILVETGSFEVPTQFHIWVFLDIYGGSGGGPKTYGSDSPGREFWPKCGPFLKKVEPSCDQTVKDRYDFSIDLG